MALRDFKGVSFPGHFLCLSQHLGEDNSTWWQWPVCWVSLHVDCKHWAAPGRIHILSGEWAHLSPSLHKRRKNKACYTSHPTGPRLFGWNRSPPWDISIHFMYIYIYISTSVCYRWLLPCRVRRERVSPTTSQTRRSPCLRGGAWTCSCWPPPFPSGSFRASGSGMITRGNTLLGMDAPTQQTNVETGNRVTVTIAAITFGSNNYLKQCLERPCHCWLFILGSFHICSY